MNRIHGARIKSAIDAAEAGTTGRIAVRVVSGRPGDALATARAHFEQARLHEHPGRNAVIFLVAPQGRRFAAFGGEAIHTRVGDEFWKAVIEGMTPYFANGDPTGALEFGIARAGDALREHFPKEPVEA